MGEFPESVKRDARRKAAYKCVLCRNQPAFEVHHVTPVAEGGTDDADNAAPLCPQCHSCFGHDHTKRRFIREARDFWYEWVTKTHGEERVRQLFAAGTAVEDAVANPKDQTRAADAKSAIGEFADSQIRSLGSLSEATARASSAGELLNIFQTITSATAISSSTVVGLDATAWPRNCPGCNKPVETRGAQFCQYCGRSLAFE